MRLRDLFLLAAAACLVAEPVLAQAAAPAVPAPPAPALLDSAVDEAYVPQDKDERGLWMEMEKVERELKVSPLVMRDPALNAYVKSVLCKLIGQARCAPVRLYIIRTSEFNATMAPNGVLEVYSGLLLRSRNEAQLAAVLGHEYTHYARRHSLQLFRDVRSKSSATMWFSLMVGGLLASLMILPSKLG